jgi:hypothetical protein
MALEKYIIFTSATDLRRTFEMALMPIEQNNFSLFVARFVARRVPGHPVKGMALSASLSRSELMLGAPCDSK